MAACPPVAEYSRKFQAQAAEELAVLPDGSAAVQMMGDYAVMREQARACTSARNSAKVVMPPPYWITVKTGLHGF